MQKHTHTNTHTHKHTHTHRDSNEYPIVAFSKNATIIIMKMCSPKWKPQQCFFIKSFCSCSCSCSCFCTWLHIKANILSSPKAFYFYSCVFGKRNYRVLVRVSVCVCVCIRVCVCFCTITQKEIDLGTRNRNTL